MNATEIALVYCRRGFATVPIPPRKKSPLLEGWERLRLAESDIPRYFNSHSNIGVLNGEPSGNLVDIDLDHPIAREIADDFLPVTGMEFGRKSSPRSHRYFRVTEAVETKHWRLPKVNGKAPMVIELRSTGSQTIWPGSVHPEGEKIEWNNDGEPATAPPSLLSSACESLYTEVLQRLGIQANGHAKKSRRHDKGGSNTTIVDRARKYIAKMPPAIDGQGGHDQTFTVACVLVIDFALGRSDALALIHEWNQGCQPPWTDRELEHKIDDAFARPGERGKLLNRDRNAGRARSGRQRSSEPQLPEGKSAVFFNSQLVGAGDDQELIPLSMRELKANLAKLTDEWPRSVAGAMFVDDDYGLRWLPKAPNLFGWIAERVGHVEWRGGPCCVTKEELHAELCRTVRRYDAVESYPHFPPRPGHYYSHPNIEIGDSSKLNQLVDRFCPSTPIDRDLILAMFVTAFWGGEPGTRPAWNINAPLGRGMGKTTLVEMVGRLVGGVFDLQPEEKCDAFKKRLLTPAAATKRLVLCDNIKTSRFSWGELEGLITAPAISGHQMYFGEQTRPNCFLWAITMNGAALSKDLAQRAITIKLGKPEYSGTWKEETAAFIEQHRWQIIGDIAAFFAQPAGELAKVSRWGAWEAAILSRLPEPNEAQQVILERQAECNVDDEESATIEDYFAQQLERLDYDTEGEWIHLPNEIACRWYREATQSSAGPTMVTRVVKQGHEEGAFPRLQPNPCRSHGRGLLWGSGNRTSIYYDLDDRIRTQMITGAGYERWA